MLSDFFTSFPPTFPTLFQDSFFESLASLQQGINFIFYIPLDHFPPSFFTYRDTFMSWSGVISYLQGSPPTAAYAGLNDGVFCSLSGKPLAWSPCQPEPGSYQWLKTWSMTSHEESLIQYLCSCCRDRFGFRLCGLERCTRTI